jgi:very-short-patch-repair endonuclease
MDVARERGWIVGNYGEAMTALALNELGYSSSGVETQFKLGAYRLDFALPLERIDSEADGWVHTADSTKARDRRRDQQLREWGWTVIRVNVDTAASTADELHKRLPPRPQVQDYSDTMRAAVAGLQVQLDRLQRRHQPAGTAQDADAGN